MGGAIHIARKLSLHPGAATQPAPSPQPLEGGDHNGDSHSLRQTGVLQFKDEHLTNNQQSLRKRNKLTQKLQTKITEYLTTEYREERINKLTQVYCSQSNWRGKHIHETVTGF